MNTNKIFYGEFCKEQNAIEKKWNSIYWSSLTEKEKQQAYLIELKLIKKHINKEIKMIQKCIGE